MKVVDRNGGIVLAADAIAKQRKLAARVRIEKSPPLESVQWIAGTDASITRDNQFLIGVITLFSWPDLRHHDSYIAKVAVEFPYIPGLLSFRELPVLLEAAKQLVHEPDIVIVDGHGIAHPRRFGLASHLGVETGWRTIGCAKGRLVGKCGDPGDEKGKAADCSHNGERIGIVLRSRKGVKPVWVSPGHRMDFEGAAWWVNRTATRYRLPEPVHVAHHEASRIRKAFVENHLK